MSTHNSNISSFSTNDILRYLQGTMTPDEMHSIEKAALDDPMLADAIDGIQASIDKHGVAQTIAGLENLNDTFSKKLHEKHTIRKFFGWQAAAAAAILIIGTILVYQLFLVKTNDQLVYQEDTSAAVKTDKEKVLQPADTTSPDLAEKDIALKTEGSIEKSSAPSVRKKQINPASVPVIVPQHEISDNEKSIADNTEMQKNKKETSGVATAPSAARQNAEGVIAANNVKDSIPNKLHLISGRVVDTNLQPLAFASLKFPKTNKLLNADGNGDFKVLSPDSIFTVKVTAAGYREQQFRVSNDVSLNQLILKPRIAPMEPDKASRSKATIPKVIIQNASPDGGWINFEQYVEKNKVYPPEDSNITGEVIVSFSVNKQGKLADFKIEQSLATAYDAEAIRLIKEGPSWKVLKGRKTRATVILRF
ncbi:MAG TPA: carboxypeptidase-like regulatory domain-containing protein [Flavitalea sp.]|nr:carboxypeptidase-like regulatory domain-containing protein [Flavitalea sp.]